MVSGPPHRRRRGSRLRLGVALAGVVLGIAVFAGTAVMQDADDLGDERFDAGRSESLAEAVAEGGPLLFSDAGGGDRDIYLNHLEDDPEEGWVAFDARAPGAGRECFLRWEDGGFDDPCGSASYPPDGRGLPHYRVTVDEDGRVLVDLRAAVTP